MSALVTVHHSTYKKKEFLVKEDLSFSDFVNKVNTRFQSSNSVCQTFADDEGHEISGEEDWEIFLVRLLRVGKNSSLHVQRTMPFEHESSHYTNSPCLERHMSSPHQSSPAHNYLFSRAKKDPTLVHRNPPRSESCPPTEIYLQQQQQNLHYHTQRFDHPFTPYSSSHYGSATNLRNVEALQITNPSQLTRHEQQSLKLHFPTENKPEYQEIPQLSLKSSPSESLDPIDLEDEELKDSYEEFKDSHSSSSSSAPSNVTTEEKEKQQEFIEPRKITMTNHDIKKEIDVNSALSSTSVANISDYHLDELRHYLTSTTESENEDKLRWRTIQSDGSSSNTGNSSSSRHDENSHFLNPKKKSKKNIKTIQLLERLESLTLEPDEYEVEISHRPFGIKFGVINNNEAIYVRRMKPDSIAAAKGVEVGDLLIGLNGKSVETLKSDKVLHLWKSIRLPFSADFKREPNSSESESSQSNVFLHEENEEEMTDSCEAEDSRISVDLDEMYQTTWKKSHKLPLILRQHFVLNFVFTILIYFPFYLILFLLLLLQIPFGLLCTFISKCRTYNPTKKIYSFNGKNIKILSWNFGFMYHRMLERRPLLLKELIQSDPDVVLSQNAVIGCESDHVNLLKMANENYVTYDSIGHILLNKFRFGEIFVNCITLYIFRLYTFWNCYFFENCGSCFLNEHSNSYSSYFCKLFFGLVWSRGSFVATRGSGYNLDDVLVLNNYGVVQRGTIQISGKKIWLVNCDSNFVSIHEEDSTIVEKIVKWIEEGSEQLGCDGIILCGSLKCQKGSKPYEFLNREGFFNVLEKRQFSSYQFSYPTAISTISKDIPGENVDFIWVKGLGVDSVKLIGEDSDVFDTDLYPSSHLGVLVSLDVH